MTDAATCSVCGKEHPRAYMEMSFRRPDEVAALPPEERPGRVKESADLCVFDGRRYFVRALLPLPVINRDRPYCLGLWAEVSHDAFDRIYALWDDTSQVNVPAFAASLANDVPGLMPALGLSLRLQLSGPTTRPHVFVTDTEHELFREQSGGITEHRAHEYSSYFA